MENSNAWIVTTLLVAAISLVGNIVQYMFPVKKAKSDEGYEIAQTLKTITEAYDKLFLNLRLEIQGFEEQLSVQNLVIEELQKVKISLEAKADKQERQLEIQRKQIASLKKQLEQLREETKAQIAK